jgi:hypothetical protein
MAKSAHAVTRVPLPSGGEFVAWWPSDATLSDLRIASKWVEAVLGGWIADAASRADAKDAGELEYVSWQVLPNV